MNTRFLYIKAGKRINVSSSCNYTVNVWFDEDGVHKSYWYDPQIGLESKSENHFTRKVPKYVIKAIEAELRRLYSRRELVFYELNQDGEERITDLRYHDDASWRQLIGFDATPETEAADAD